MVRLFYLAIVLFISGLCSAQVVSTDPVFVTENDSVTIVFNANLGNGALKDLGPPEVYAHSGVITSKSTTASDWRYVQGNWGKVDAKMKMTYLGANLYRMKFHIRSFYGVPTDEKILKLAFVFRNADGSKVGRNGDGSDIFIELFENTTNVLFTEPTENNTILEKFTPLKLNIVASESGKIVLYQNGNALDSVWGTSFQYLDSLPNAGTHQFIAELITTFQIVRDTVDITVNGDIEISALPSNYSDGITYVDSSTVFLSLYAPHKSYVYVIGDFNQWNASQAYFMKQTPDGKRWWLQISGLKPDKIYGFQYWVDGKIRIADPYSTVILDPDNDHIISSPNLPAYPAGKTRNIVGLLFPGAEPFPWQEFAFKKPAREKLNIYEMHIRDFIQAHNYQTLTDTLMYFKKLGINAIQLMPVNEFEGNSSWGYNTSFHMALDKYYGSPESFKTFIQECHRQGIAVILDVVFNHAFSQNSLCRLYWDDTNFRPTADNPWVNVTAKHDFNVGYDFNHESEATQAYMDKILKYWLDEYKIDGFRFDLSKGFTQKNTLGNVGAWGNYDASRINLLKRMRTQIISTHPDTYLILEHFADNNEEKVLADEGFMLWGNMNHAFLEASMGFASDFQWLSYKNRDWTQSALVGYMESHDEERMMYKNLNFGDINGNYNIKQLPTALDRAALSAVLFFSVPGPKMIWQFGELGYDYSINYNSRLGEKPIRWDYLKDQNRKDLFQTYSDMMYLRNEYPIFHSADFEMNTSSAIKTIKLNDGNQHALVVGNFNTKSQTASLTFQKTGTWFEYFTGDSLIVSNINSSIPLMAGEYRLYSTQKFNRPERIFVSENQKNSEEFILYPNPVLNEIWIKIPQERSIDAVTITSVTGQRIIADYRCTDGNSIKLPESLSAGVYTIRIQSGSQVYTYRFVKQ